MAYKLDLPEVAGIHAIVHMSQLKRHVPPSVTIEQDITQLLIDPSESVQLIAFKATRKLQKGSSSLFQIQVQWSGYPPSLVTWEEVHDLKRRSRSSPRRRSM